MQKSTSTGVIFHMTVNGNNLDYLKVGLTWNPHGNADFGVG